MATVKKRHWKLASGAERSAWIVCYTAARRRHIRAFKTKKEAENDLFAGRPADPSGRFVASSCRLISADTLAKLPRGRLACGEGRPVQVLSFRVRAYPRAGSAGPTASVIALEDRLFGREPCERL